MAYHEQHERKCPSCGEQISATAPKCFNCGEFVNDGEEDEEEEVSRPRASRGLVWGLVAVLIAVGLVVYLRPGHRAEPDPNDPLRRLLTNKVEQLQGASLNRMSPETVESLGPRLRVGMTHDE